MDEQEWACSSRGLDYLINKSSKGILIYIFSAIWNEIFSLEQYIPFCFFWKSLSPLIQIYHFWIYEILSLILKVKISYCDSKIYHLYYFSYFYLGSQLDFFIFYGFFQIYSLIYFYFVISICPSTFTMGFSSPFSCSLPICLISNRLILRFYLKPNHRF